MNREQLYAAQANMIEQLKDPHELGKSPSKIESAGEFELYEMHYYIFKYKASLFGEWLVGIRGGFEGDSLEPCGHTFSDMQKYNAVTAQNDCVVMVERIRACWMEQTKKYGQEN